MVFKSMKKMSVLFLIFTVMLPSISWGGIADGKSIICHCINCSLTTEERGWAFLDGKVTYVFPSTYKDEVTIKEESWGSYWSDENTIGWMHEGMGRVLDRSTLIITDTLTLMRRVGVNFFSLCLNLKKNGKLSKEDCNLNTTQS